MVTNKNKKVINILKKNNRKNKKIKGNEPLLERMNKRLKRLSVSIPLALSFLLTPLRFNFNKMGFTPVELNKARAQEVNTSNTKKDSVKLVDLATLKGPIDINKVTHDTTLIFDISREEDKIIIDTLELIPKEELIKRIHNTLFNNKEDTAAFRILRDINAINRYILGKQDKNRFMNLNLQYKNIAMSNEIKDTSQWIDTLVYFIANGVWPNIYLNEDDSDVTTEKNARRLLEWACEQDKLLLVKFLVYLRGGGYIINEFNRQAITYAFGIDVRMAGNLMIAVKNPFFGKKVRVGNIIEFTIKKEPNVEIVKFLLEHGAAPNDYLINIDFKDYYGLRPLSYILLATHKVHESEQKGEMSKEEAERYIDKYKKIAHLLLKYGASFVLALEPVEEILFSNERLDKYEIWDELGKLLEISDDQL